MNTLALFSLDNKTLLLIVIAVLIFLVIMLTVLGIVFIIALRKRRPVIKVVMAPPPLAQPEPQVVAPVATTAAPVAAEPVVEQSVEEQPETEEEEDDGDGVAYVTEGQERVHYNRSFEAKICQLSDEAKEWYSALKNELLSYEKVKERTSWKRETFRMGRMAVARLTVRGKTLCLLIAVEPIGYNGTKYKVEDVSNMANTVDTPTLYRIKSPRRLKYAKEMIADLMRELKTFKKAGFVAQDYFVPYAGDMALMQRGLVKRVVSGSTRVFKIEEVDAEEIEETNDSAETDNGENA